MNLQTNTMCSSRTSRAGRRGHGLATLLMCACLWGPAAVGAGADEEPRGTREFDLRELRAPAAPNGPNLAAPCDLLPLESYEGAGAWNVDWSTDAGTWMPFARPYLEGRGVSVDTVIELLSVTLPLSIRERGELAVEPYGEGLRVQGTAGDVAAAEQSLPWVLGALAARRAVEAELWLATGADGPARLRAVGQERLWPGRWARVYLEKEEVPCTPIWDIEVAEGVTIMDPSVVPLVEGHELYLRYHPGESVDLIEVWAGNLVHREQVLTDISGLRNLPEAAGAAAASYMRTAIGRGYTTLVVPRAEAAHRELMWEVEGLRLGLALRIDAAPQAIGPSDGPDAGSEVLRVGAAAAPLEFGGRADLSSEIADRIGASTYAHLLQTQNPDELQVCSVLEGGEVLFVQGAAEPRRLAREVVKDAESRLRWAQLGLRWIEVDEPVWRALWQEGAARLGRALAPEQLARLFEGGAVARGELRIPVLLGGPPTGMRLGRNEPGLQDLDCEIAGRSAGLRPETTAAFAGWHGSIAARTSPRDLRVTVSGVWSWADGQAGQLEVMLREPYQGAFAPEGWRPTAAAERRVRLPVMGGGASTVERELELPGAGGQHWLTQVVVREAQVVILLLSAQVPETK